MKRFESIGAATCQGPNPEQQDTYMCSSRLGMLAVFDGHGDEGLLAAKTARNHFWAMRGHGQIGPDLGDDFTAINDRIGDIRGGTTATVVQVGAPNAVTRSRLITAHYVGDSPALLIDPDGGEEVPLTRPHDIRNPAEVSRMQRAGYEVTGQHFLLPGSGKLSVSRSLGDAHHGPVITHVPNISKVESSRERVLMVATDGVLSRKTTPKVIEVTRNHAFEDGWSMQAIAVEIVRIFADQTGDNATVVLAHLPAIE